MDAPVKQPATSSKSTARSTSVEREHRVIAQPGFVLHSYPYKETSLIVEVFARDYGRVPVVAKGAKRPHSKLRGVLQTFQPLQLSWSGKSEVRTLISAEWVGGLLPVEGSALLCGFYLNELLVKLLARDDPHPVLFDAYMSALNQLAHGEPAGIVLRKFELQLLKESVSLANSPSWGRAVSKSSQRVIMCLSQSVDLARQSPAIPFQWYRVKH